LSYKLPIQTEQKSTAAEKLQLTLEALAKFNLGYEKCQGTTLVVPKWQQNYVGL